MGYSNGVCGLFDDTKGMIFRNWRDVLVMWEVDNFYSRICGKLLGDDCITKQQRRKSRFQSMHRKVKDLRLKKKFYEIYVV